MQDETEITTPATGMPNISSTVLDQPAAQVGAPPQIVRPRGYIALWILTSVLTVITLISLAINIVIARQLFEVRRLTRLAIYDSIQVIHDLQSQTYAYNVVIDDTIVVDDDVPFQETIPVVIDETMPFGTSVTVPVDIGPFGRYPVSIPIGGSIPINLEFDVPVDETVPVYIEVPVHTEIPIEITVSETPLYNTLVSTETSLQNLAAELDKPLFWFLMPQGANAGD